MFWGKNILKSTWGFCSSVTVNNLGCQVSPFPTTILYSGLLCLIYLSMTYSEIKIYNFLDNNTLNPFGNESLVTLGNVCINVCLKFLYQRIKVFAISESYEVELIGLFIDNNHTVC